MCLLRVDGDDEELVPFCARVSCCCTLLAGLRACLLLAPLGGSCSVRTAMPNGGSGSPSSPCDELVAFRSLISSRSKNLQAAPLPKFVKKLDEVLSLTSHLSILCMLLFHWQIEICLVNLLGFGPRKIPQTIGFKRTGDLCSPIALPAML